MLAVEQGRRTNQSIPYVHAIYLIGIRFRLDGCSATDVINKLVGVHIHTEIF